MTPIDSSPTGSGPTTGFFRRFQAVAFIHLRSLWRLSTLYHDRDTSVEVFRTTFRDPAQVLLFHGDGTPITTTKAWVDSYGTIEHEHVCWTSDAEQLAVQRAMLLDIIVVNRFEFTELQRRHVAGESLSRAELKPGARHACY